MLKWLLPLILFSVMHLILLLFIPFLCLIYVFLNMNVIVATWSTGAPSPRAPKLNCASRLQFPGCR